jgi:NDP-sugar pyrophosphorylase family protein
VRAFILAAGLGTRLRPLTDHTPKPLVPLLGRPMIAYALDWLERNGCNEVLINVHYRSDQLIQFVMQEKLRRPHFIFAIQDESPLILGSGGAVLQALPWLFANNQQALILNSDALTKISLNEFVSEHHRLRAKHQVECSLALMHHEDAGRKYNAFAMKDHLITEHVKAEPKRIGDFYHFPGFYILEKSGALRLKKESGAFCIVEKLWKPLIQEKKLGAWEYKGPYQDLGTEADLKEGEDLLKSGKFS